MRRHLAGIVLLLHAISCSGKPPVTSDSIIIHSVIVNDDYLIRVRKPANFSSDKNYRFVYVTDGSIGLGDYVLGKDSSWMAAIPENCLIITIGHTGSWEQKRRRDFIPSDAGAYHDERFGRANQFYEGLTTEIIPAIEKLFPNKADRVLVGHSFGGLFALYAALKERPFFDQVFAISPSVWANNNELLKIEQQFYESNQQLKIPVLIFAGGLELFNKVLSSSKAFYKALVSRNYPDADIRLEVIGNANHFSIRKPAIDRILLALAP